MSRQGTLEARQKHGFVTPVFSVKPSLSRCHGSFHLYVRARAYASLSTPQLYKKRHFRPEAWQFAFVALDFSTIDSRLGSKIRSYPQLIARIRS